MSVNLNIWLAGGGEGRACVLLLPANDAFFTFVCIIIFSPPCNPSVVVAVDRTEINMGDHPKTEKLLPRTASTTFTASFVLAFINTLSWNIEICPLVCTCACVTSGTARWSAQLRQHRPQRFARRVSTIFSFGGRLETIHLARAKVIKKSQEGEEKKVKFVWEKKKRERNKKKKLIVVVNWSARESSCKTHLVCHTHSVIIIEDVVDADIPPPPLLPDFWRILNYNYKFPSCRLNDIRLPDARSLGYKLGRHPKVQ